MKVEREKGKGERRERGKVKVEREKEITKPIKFLAAADFIPGK